MPMLCVTDRPKFVRCKVFMEYHVLVLVESSVVTGSRSNVDNNTWECLTQEISDINSLKCISQKSQTWFHFVDRRTVIKRPKTIWPLTYLLWGSKTSLIWTWHQHLDALTLYLSKSNFFFPFCEMNLTGNLRWRLSHKSMVTLSD